MSSGSSWGANPLEQHIGLAKADRIAVLEIHWPTSGTTQVFRDIAANQAIEVTELEDQIRALPRKPIATQVARRAGQRRQLVHTGRLQPPGVTSVSSRISGP